MLERHTFRLLTRPVVKHLFHSRFFILDQLYWVKARPKTRLKIRLTGARLGPRLGLRFGSRFASFKARPKTRLIGARP